MFVNFNCNHASREMFPRGSVNKVIEVNEQVVVAVLVFAPIKLFIVPEELTTFYITWNKLSRLKKWLSRKYIMIIPIF